MKLIVGLGNPGANYADTRHNIGFLVIKSLGRNLGIALRRHIGIRSLSGKGKAGFEELILALPLTFMNLSGSAVKQLFKKYKIAAKDLLIVCDDLDLELGRMKLRPKGSSGGHRGLESIAESLGTKDFSRLRIGIGGPSEVMDAADYVLSPFDRSELNRLQDIIDRAVDCCEVWAQEDIDEAMNIFNKKENK